MTLPSDTAGNSPEKWERDAFIMHFDLDAFFASVEQKLNPHYQGKPLVVAGKGGRGVVAAASYEARQYGIKSAMPTSMALQRYPQLIIVDPRFDAYRAVSQEIMKLARELSETLEALSLDEAYLDLEGYSLEECITKARAFRQKVKDGLNLAVSVGIANTKILAKLASDQAKPDGLRVIRPEAASAYIKEVEIAKIWGIGPSAQTKLGELGVKTAGDLQEVNLRVLTGLFGNSQGNNLYKICRNIDERKVESTRERKSISQETTFPKDNANRQELEEILNTLSLSLASKMNSHQVGAKTINLKVRYGDFRTITRSKSFQSAFEDHQTLTQSLKALLSEIDLSQGIRLLGVSVSNLRKESQLSLFGEELAILPSGDKKKDLNEMFFWGMEVAHPVFGHGRVRELSGDTLSIDFSGRMRILSTQAPLERFSFT